MHTTIQAETACAVAIAGSEATLTINGPFYMPGGFTVGDRRYDEPPVRHGALHYQAAEVARCVADGRTRSALRPLEDSLTTLGALDAVRDRIAVTVA
jgi:hypothetical protein